jgi:hypothetical protein
MFPDAQRVLHLFSGSLPADEQGRYVRFDCQGNADVIGDAHELSRYFAPDTFDLILADAPYSVEDAEHYGTPMIKRNTVLAECGKVLQRDGFIVWLDQVLPMFRKSELHLCGAIGVVRSTNHRFRVASFFRKIRDIRNPSKRETDNFQKGVGNPVRQIPDRAKGLIRDRAHSLRRGPS